MDRSVADLSFRVFLSPSVETASRDLPPGVRVREWPPIAATLIYGRREAILIDPLLTRSQATALADWVRGSGKELTTIYVTHGHGDHWFGSGTVLRHFPGAGAVATAEVVETMRRQAAPEFVARYWEATLPGQIPEDLTPARPTSDTTLELEGNELRIVPLGRTDGVETAALHVPSIGLVVAGDTTYGEVHLHLSESPEQGRRDWLTALDRLDALHPTSVVAGHQHAPGAVDPGVIQSTRSYIRDFDRLAKRTDTARTLYDEMLSIYPEWLNRAALWSASKAEKP